MAVTLRDVAVQAGVSVRTVSNVVNQKPHVRPATKARVLEAISALGYRPNLSARQLKYGRGGFLALVVPELEAPYFAELAALFTQVCVERGYLGLLESTGGTRHNEQLVLRGAQTHMIDGILFSPLSLSGPALAERSPSQPMVLLGEREPPPGWSHVAVDSVASSRAVTEHLIATGRRRIAVIGHFEHDRSIGTGLLRFRGVTQALDAAGLPFDRQLLLGVRKYDQECGRRAMLELLRRDVRPDAVVCFNDLMAFGAIRACYEAGVAVPDDIAITGFDGIRQAAFSTPSLTTITPDVDTLVRSAVDLLINGNGNVQVEVPWSLTIRESTTGRSSDGPVGALPVRERDRFERAELNGAEGVEEP
ncbi:LacI family DNA-binding transcriptional regulator [Kribbella sp.]|uniref:LacI family DNA-binding transcriptional regulator n=1 Tax=Kribbella sp. TaxID=1871183 RepID=UPI002D2CF394|nr:LacI family DNA-binding transcriptional regulator [Kribbella sp.]HZX02812.1 LacI family DNA-binding transcriptional regulator [Kribbella sp.]